jgi:hypothetical protein
METVLPEHLTKWKEEMGPSYDALFLQAFPQPTSSEIRSTAGNQMASTALKPRGIPVNQVISI